MFPAARSAVSGLPALNFLFYIFGLKMMALRALSLEIDQNLAIAPSSGLVLLVLGSKHPELVYNSGRTFFY